MNSNVENAVLQAYTIISGVRKYMIKKINTRIKETKNFSE